MSGQFSPLREMDQRYVAHTYRRFPVEIERGSGSEVFDGNGKRYIDMGSGIGVTAFGIADPVWQEAVIRQVGQVQHMSNLYYTRPCAELAKMLCEKTGMEKVFFSNSGAEANECAIKVARKFQAERKGPDCATIVTMKNSFHGRTLTTLAATGQDHYHELFQPLTPGFLSVAPEEVDQLANPEKIAAVMIECIQGEGGVVPLAPETLARIAAFTKENDILLMVDEVQTGNGRTGKLYSYMHYGLAPDVVSTAKGLAGGLPLGATLLSGKVQDTLGYGDHGSTFGGNPVSCAGALSILSRLDDGLMTSVREKGAYLMDRFRAAPGVSEVTGLGLMVGFRCARPAGEVVAAAMEKGVLCLTAKDKVRLLPALNISWELLREAADILCACMA
ncbi:MAG: aminotransferase class III-fold pyridoxal phosphate-dependent enzyme [Clostridia bacterium]|nr:aminotransferase class III-fold pyridoxal phosphate-dependent enzyme [Clostridia bacterium]